MSAANPPVSYGKIWVILVALVAIGVAALAIPSKTLAVVLIFAAALVKAVIVIRHYMHLVKQPPMVYAMLGVPLLLAIMMALILTPDIGMHYRSTSTALPGAEHAAEH